MDQKSTPRMILIGVVFLMIIFVMGTFVLSKTDSLSSLDVRVKNEPTLGDLKAKVHVVVFEDPKCTSCKIFTSQVFPELKKAYIDTNKVSFSIIPISYIHNSMPAAEALVCVYHQNSDNPDDKLFFDYLQTIYKNQPPENEDWATPDYLIKLAQETSPNIDLDKLKYCLSNDAYYTQIMRDTEYANQLIGTLSTPKIFVNGTKAESSSYAAISKLIEDALTSGSPAVTETAPTPKEKPETTAK